MSDATSYKIHCSECLRPLPDDASYCPFCGRTVMASTRAERAREQFGTGIVGTGDAPDDGDDATSLIGGLRRLSRRSQLAVAAVAIVLVAAVGVAVLLFGSRGASAERSGAERANATRHVSQHDESPERANLSSVGAFTYELGTDPETDHQLATIEYGGEETVRLYTPRETGYENLEHRTQGVTLRLEWVARRHAIRSSQGQTSNVSTRPRGDDWEVVWTDGDATYRLLRVTSEDVRHWNQRPDADLSGAELAATHARRVGALLSRVADRDSNV